MIRPNEPLWQQMAIHGLANTPPAMSEAAILQWSNNGQINANVIEHLKSYLTMRPIVDWGPYEIHPYIYRETKHFNLSRKLLLLGTFPPNSYLHNVPAVAPSAANHPSVSSPPDADFFYGNMATLWFLFGLPNLEQITIETFLERNSISISDVVLGTQRRKFSSAADKELFNMLPNDQLCTLFSSKSLVKTILFTSGKLRSLYLSPNGKIRIDNTIAPTTMSLFLKILLEYCKLPLEISGDPSGKGPFYKFGYKELRMAIEQQNGHVISYIRVGDKVIRLINLPNPAVGIGHMRQPIFRKWLIYKITQNNLPPLPTTDWKIYMAQHPNVFDQQYANQFRSEIYQMAINNLQQLINL